MRAALMAAVVVASATVAVAPMPTPAEPVPAAATQSMTRGDRVTGRPFGTRGPVLARNGMVSTSHPLAAQAALDILKAGGSAVDAAIAANAVLGVVEPVGGGVGGDAFALVWDPKTGRLYGLNGSGASPSGLSAEELRRRLGPRTAIPLWGALPVTVPGAVDAWFELHGRFGRLPMRKVLQPAIRLARDGHPVAVDVAFYLAICLRRYEADIGSIEEFDNFRRTFMPGGHLPKAGEVFRNPDLARTYELIATGGRREFYEGSIARRIDRYMRRVGGYLSIEDLRRHASRWVDPIETDYRGYRVVQMPPNSQGATLLQMLNILENFDLAALPPSSAEFMHLMVEAKKLAFADRAMLIGDPEASAPAVSRLMSKEYAAGLALRIDPRRAMDLPVQTPASRGGDTVYIATADSDGMMVSLIQSNFQGMGSGLVPDGTGFVLQDRGAQFDPSPGRVNSYAPGRRPFHTIMPGFVLRDGKPWLAFGVIGGDMQPQAQAQILSYLIDHGFTVQEAGDAARIHHVGGMQPTGERGGSGPGVVEVERSVPDATLEALRSMGHAVRVGERVFGAYQGILYDPDQRVYWGGSDSRLDGQAVGY
jgi:gamma-glutamyltranspeptidase/glutathione hydrolase